MIDFLKYKSACMFFSLALIASGLVAYFMQGGFKYAIDFAGGAEINISFEKSIDIGVLRNAISSQGWQDSVIQSIGKDGKNFIVKLGGVTVEGLEDKFRMAVDAATPGNTMTVTHIDWIGAEVGKDMKKNAIFAVLLSILAILLYVAIRSKFAYGVGAVVALCHDMLAVLVCILLFKEQISLSVLAAILAILGYSINDTIVIFSRIRDNVKKMKDHTLNDIVNISINQTLRRTLLTSFSTLLSVIAFYVLGGESLRGFSFVMMLGIIFGTYSSIYIASPVMIYLEQRAAHKKEVL